MLTRFDKRFGPEYFRRVPESAGVFWMSDSRKKPLLIGHSKNLRLKLLLLRFHFSTANPKHIMSIPSQIHEINWCNCSSLEEALSLKQKLTQEVVCDFSFESFDFQNYYYLNVSINKDLLKISLSAEPDHHAEHTFGAFRGQLPAHFAYTSLLRWLRFYHNGGSAMQWPSPFNKNLMPKSFHLIQPFDKKLKFLIVDFLTGESKELILNLTERLELERDSMDKFTRLWLHQDLQRLVRFYQTIILRNKSILNELKIKKDWLDPEWATPIRIKTFSSGPTSVPTSTSISAL